MAGLSSRDGMTSRRPLRSLLESSRDIWDTASFRPDAREAFARAVDCGTGRLGAEVFSSGQEELVVPHTCKSRACPSCGHRATLQWQRERWCALPDAPYLHVCLTMPDVLWPIFRRNRHLLRDLPALGAEVIQQVSRQRTNTSRLIIVFPHTFGRHLNFNCHLHVLVSSGGLNCSTRSWTDSAPLHREATMRMWRYAVTQYLSRALSVDLLRDEAAGGLQSMLRIQSARRWIIDVKCFQTKAHVLRYAGRYARKPPLAQHRLRDADGQVVRFSTKDTRLKRVVDTTYTTEAFLRLLADHLPDRGRHNVRYFGLLAPRSHALGLRTVFADLGQRPRLRPRPTPWAASLERWMGRSPLSDSARRRMVWVGRRTSSALPG